MINEPSGADRSYSSSSQFSEPGASYETRTYRSASGEQLDPDTEADRVLHLYQRGRPHADWLDHKLKENAIVVMPEFATENFQSSYRSDAVSEPAVAVVETSPSASVSTQANEQSDLNKSEPERAAAAGVIATEPAGAERSDSAVGVEQKSSTDLNSDATSASSSLDTSKEIANEPAGAASDSDRMLSEKIQTAIKDDSSLSDSDVRVKVMNGKITLMGTVKNEQEKTQIMEKARQALEIDDSQLTVGDSNAAPDSK